MDPTLLRFCLLMAAAFVGVIVLAVAVKLAEVYRARDWPQTTGAITKSKVRSHKHRPNDEGYQYASEPLVTYEYTVDRKPFRGTRINFAERIRGADVMETLARYPVGTQVTVYYNPANPAEAVLERTLPPVVGKGVALLILFFLAAILGVPLVLTAVAGLIAPALPQPERAFPIVLLCALGLFALLLWYAMQKQVWAARGWSVINGRVLAANVESYQTDDDNHPTTLFRPSIVYQFEANGQQFVSDRVNFGGQMGASIAGSAPWFVRDRAAKYPVGSEVIVYYNPQNPTESVLERRAPGLIMLWGVAFVLWALAAVFAGLIG